MTDTAGTRSQSSAALPPDDPLRRLSVVDPDSANVRHISVVGDTYTILLSGEDTAGGYCLIDMHVPFCGGPGPHRHDFEEMFTLIEGEIEFTFRGEKTMVKAGTNDHRPGQRTPFFPQRLGQDGADAEHVFTGRTGGVFHGDRQDGRKRDRVPTEAQQRGAGAIGNSPDRLYRPTPVPSSNTSCRTSQRASFPAKSMRA
jgi:hypothetical protein